MAINYTEFCEAFPEFATKPDKATVVAKLTAAQTFCDATRWGNRYQHGVFLKAAHMIALSPGGEKMLLAKGSRETVYSVQFAEMLMALPVRSMTT